MLVFTLFVFTVESSKAAKHHGWHYATKSNRAKSYAFLIGLSSNSLRSGLGALWKVNLDIEKVLMRGLGVFWWVSGWEHEPCVRTGAVNRATEET